MQHFVELGHCMAVPKDVNAAPFKRQMPFSFVQSFASLTRQQFQCYILQSVYDQAEAERYQKALASLGIMPDWVIPFAKDTVVDPEFSKTQHYATHSLLDYTQSGFLCDKLAYVDLLYLSSNALVGLDVWALQQLFTLCTRIKINGGRICFYSYYQPELWGSGEQLQTAMQLLEPLMDSVLYDAQSFQLLTCMDDKACLSYLRQRLIHDILIKLPDATLLVADACVEARVDMSQFYQSSCPEQDEIMFSQYMAGRAQGASPGAVLSKLLAFNLDDQPLLAQCNPYRSKPRHHYSM